MYLYVYYIVTLAVYPHLVEFTGKIFFAAIVDPLNFESQNQAKNIHGSPEFQSNFRKVDQGVPELWSDKQTEITTL